MLLQPPAAAMRRTVPAVEETDLAVFRSALGAMWNPGRIETVRPGVELPALQPAQAQLLNVLTDEFSAVWWQHGRDALAPLLQAATGARAVPLPGQCSFAVVTDARRMPALAAFTGSAPRDDIVTLLVEVESLREGIPVPLAVPGCAEAWIAAEGLAPGFWAQLDAAPACVDVFLTCGAEFMGVPRGCKPRFESA